MYDDMNHNNENGFSQENQPPVSPAQPQFSEQQTQQYGFFDQNYQQSPKPPKKKNRGRKIVLGIVGIAAACAVVATASIGGFVALLHAGIINLPASISSSASSDSSGSGSSAAASAVQQVSQKDANALTLQQVAAKVTPSVVYIENTSVTSGFGQQPSESAGSGVVMTSDGYIITNHHVVDGATLIKVVMFDGKEYNAKLVGSDAATDLAVIKIDATGLTPAEFGNSDELQVGDTMVAIGNPGGITLNSSVTFGYVSALNRSIETTNGYTVNCIQTDAAINPGNSGGALVNIYGQVVGINSSKIVDTSYEGLGFAIAVNEVLPVAESLKQYGYVKDRAVIGIGYQYIDETTASYYHMPQGLYVATVSSDNAKKAGLEQGDIITEMDGKAITSTSVIAQVLSSKKPGDSVSMKVYKSSSGQTVSVNVVLSQYTADK